MDNKGSAFQRLEFWVNQISFSHSLPTKQDVKVNMGLYCASSIFMVVTEYNLDRWDWLHNGMSRGGIKVSFLVVTCSFMSKDKQ